jgi:glycosyltransferase involved in cell wall biosynthesis
MTRDLSRLGRGEVDMKVCILGLRGLPSVMGGVEMHCEQLFPRLRKLRPDDSFTIIARTGYVSQAVSEYEGLRIVSLGHAKSRHLETITNTIYGVIYARFILGAELLHLHGIGPALVTPIAKTLGMKVIVTYHSKNYEHRKWNRFARSILLMGEFCAVTFADTVIAVSQCLASDLKRRFPKAASKIHFIPNGANHIDKAGLNAGCRCDVLARHGLGQQQYIVAVGRLVPEKGFHDLQEAFTLARLDRKLVIVGDADHRDKYSRCLIQKASESIVFTGFVPHDAVRDLLENASLFVLPSHNEGLPIAALEALDANVPILLSNIEPNLDLGLGPSNYFSVGNVGDLRSKLSQDHELYRVHPVDRAKILGRYDWSAVSTETDKIYSALQH